MRLFSSAIIVATDKQETASLRMLRPMRAESRGARQAFCRLRDAGAVSSNYRVLTALVRHGFQAVLFCRRPAAGSGRHRSARGDARERSHAQTDLSRGREGLPFPFASRLRPPMSRRRRKFGCSSRKTKDTIGISRARSRRLRQGFDFRRPTTANIGSRFARSTPRDAPIPTGRTIRNCG